MSGQIGFFKGGEFLAKPYHLCGMRSRNTFLLNGVSEEIYSPMVHAVNINGAPCVLSASTLWRIWSQ
jgi:hypothetical protein